MKQVGNILSVISFVGVIALFFVFKSASDSIAHNPDHGNADTVITSQKNAGKIAFVKVDSLMKHYKRAEELRTELNQSRIKLEGELTSRQKKLMSDADAFRVRAATMSNFEAQQRQKELLEREQQLMQLEQNYSQRLAYTEAGFSNEINDSLNAFLAVFMQSNDYQLILSDNQAGAVLWGSPSIDITQEVIDGMNARLANKTTAEPEKK